VSSTVKIRRNSPKCFIVGASWSHDPNWGKPRQTYVYLGPFLLTVTTTSAEVSR
jgi:hypothetical protein